MRSEQAQELNEGKIDTLFYLSSVSKKESQISKGGKI